MNSLVNLKGQLATTKQGVKDMKYDLAKAIAKKIDENGWTQTQAALYMQDAPSQISLVVTGKLRGFSFERLLRMYLMLGNNLELRGAPVKKPARGRTPAPRVTVKL